MKKTPNTKQRSQRVLVRLITPIILLAALWTTKAADVEFYGLVKMQRFEQGNAAAPALSEPNEWDPGDSAPFAFDVFVDLSGSNTVPQATVTLPGGALRMLTLSEEGEQREFADFLEFKPELDAVYSNGLYTLSLQTEHDGEKNLELVLPMADAYPNPPRISNFTPAQSINAAAGFTLTWDAFSSGSDTDFVEVEVFDPDTDAVYFQTGGPGEPGSLDGTSVSVSIPGGTLPPGHGLVGRLLFAKLVDVDDTTYGGGVTGLAGFLAETTFPVRTIGGTDFESPQVQSHFPQNWQTDVGSKATISFSFSETMNTGLPAASSIAWSGNVTAGLFNFTWSADGRTLFCVYPPGLPPNSVITWELNPEGSPRNLRDLAGNLLPTEGGSFVTSGDTDTGVTDVRSLALVKGRLFRQSDSAATDLSSYQFALTTDLNVLNSVTNGLLTLPNGRSLSPGPDFGETVDLEAQYSSAAQVDLFFPAGTYQARYDTVHDGPHTFSLSLSAAAYPNAPVILDYASAQSVNPSNSFMLSWSEFAGGTANDFIRLEIETDNDFQDTVFATPDFNEPGALDGVGTSAVIPAFTLAPGRTYHGTLIFARVLQRDTTTYPGVTAAAAYFTATSFELNTSGEIVRPSLQISALSPGTVRITVTGERNRFYTVESSDGLPSSPFQWGPWTGGYTDADFNGFMGSFQFDDSTSDFGNTRFYRARGDDGVGDP